MASLNHDRTANQEAYRRSRVSLASMYGFGRYIAFCGGKVAADSGTFDGLLQRLAGMGENPSNALIVQAGANYPEKVVIFLVQCPS